MRKKKIDIIGWYGRNNVGDDAFQHVFTNWFMGHDLNFVTPPQHTRADADLVILGGGAVLSEFYLKHITNSDNLIALGVDSEWPSQLDALLASKPQLTSFRSREDVRVYGEKELALSQQSAGQYGYCPDLVFDMKPSLADGARRYKTQRDKRTVAVFLTDYVMPAHNRDLYYWGPRADQLCHGLGQVLEKLSEKVEILLMPCSTQAPGNDNRVNLHVASFMRNKPTIVARQLNPQDMIDLIADCEFTLCQRFHSHVMSLIAGTPFASIEFTTKVKTLVIDYQNHFDRSYKGVGVPRGMTAVQRKADGFFTFDNTYELLNQALDAGTRKTENQVMGEYTQDNRRQVESLRKFVVDCL